MKGKYITWQILMAALATPAKSEKDIHEQLKETIADRKRIMQKLETFSQTAKIVDAYLGKTKAA